MDQRATVFLLRILSVLAYKKFQRNMHWMGIPHSKYGKLPTNMEINDTLLLLATR